MLPPFYPTKEAATTVHPRRGRDLMFALGIHALALAVYVGLAVDLLVKDSHWDMLATKNSGPPFGLLQSGLPTQGHSSGFSASSVSSRGGYNDDQNSYRTSGDLTCSSGSDFGFCCSYPGNERDGSSSRILEPGIAPAGGGRSALPLTLRRRTTSRSAA